MGNHTEQLSGGMTDCLSGLGQSTIVNGGVLRWMEIKQSLPILAPCVGRKYLSKKYVVLDVNSYITE